MVTVRVTQCNILIKHAVKLCNHSYLQISDLILQDFVFPEDVSSSIGGPDTSRYMVIEMHYDNPARVQGEYF